MGRALASYRELALPCRLFPYPPALPVLFTQTIIQRGRMQHWKKSPALAWFKEIGIRLAEFSSRLWHNVPFGDDIFEHRVSREVLRRAIQDSEDVELYGVPGQKEAIYKAATKLLSNGIGDVNATRIRRLLGFRYEYKEWQKQ